ncbi:hypothetical protein Tsubulata_013905 [Turnera subulata]|uniref:Pentacotripeptide-repeat region of PRORP domain-containing protein n=1 Tax=Turnera subulata TaxID=218843 RepID=A0A9Q0JMV4_9ROSI|nr:hypothetical protein Tsubulata_013905 [Turnera subulata]
MAALSNSTNPFPRPFNRLHPPNSKPIPEPVPRLGPVACPSSSASSSGSNSTELAPSNRVERRGIVSWEKVKNREEKERREAVNRKVASQKAVSIILRREATKAIIEKKKGPTNSKRLLPRTVLEALHERISAYRWESALKVFELLKEQLWYKPNAGVYIKLIVMLGKCKQPEKAEELFQAMIGEGCVVNHEAYTALLSAYSRSGLIDDAFSLLEEMKNSLDCRPDVQTYSVLIKSCLQAFAFDKVQTLLSDMSSQGISPNTITYNTLIDAYGKAKKFAEMEATLLQMLGEENCEPDVWTMNSTLRAFGGSGQIEMMENCYDKFQSAGIEPNIKTFNILLDSYGKVGDYKKMSSVMQYMQKYHYSWSIVTMLHQYLRKPARPLNLVKELEDLLRSVEKTRVFKKKPDF